MADKPRDPHPALAAWYAETLCSGCKAGQLLYWEREEVSIGGGDWPQHAVAVDNHWAVVHCDYFRRRVERPDQLAFCDAKRTR